MVNSGLHVEELCRRAVDSKASVMIDEVFARLLRAIKEESSQADVIFSGLLSLFKGYASQFCSAFPNDKFFAFLDALFASAVHRDAFMELLAQASMQFSDVRLFALKFFTSRDANLCFSFLAELNMYEAAENIDSVLVGVSASSDPRICNWKQHRAQYTRAWLHVLKKSTVGNKRLLVFLDEQAVSILTRPSLVADFFTKAYSDGGINALLSLSGLLHLMIKHKLDYPAFYDKLYSALTPDIFSNPLCRKRCVKLVSKVLGSKFLSDVACAAIVKRVSSLSLGASPAALKSMIPLIYNCIKMRPRLLALIHQDLDESVAWKDPFDLTNGIEASCADQSSLFELEILAKHFYGPVANSFKLFSQPLARPPFDLNQASKDEDSFSSLLQAELTHRWSKKPPTRLDFPVALLE